MSSFRTVAHPLGLIVLVSVFCVLACSTPEDDKQGTGGAGGATASGASGLGAGGSAGTSTASGGRAASTGGSAGTATMTTGGTGGASAGVGGSTGGSAGTSASAGTGGSTQGGAPATGGAGGMSQGGVAGTVAGGAGQAPAGTGGGGSDGMAGGAAGTAAGGSSGGSAHTGIWHIMPLGDSITGTTCYPQLLSKKLLDGGHTNFDFRGTNTNNQSCNGAPNVVTEGHGGYILGCLTGDFTSNCSSKGTTAELSTWLAATPAPDVVLIHFGTNDVWNNIPTNTITTSYTHLLASLRGANPNVMVFIAQILPMHPDNCMDSSSSCPNVGVMALNAAIPGWASGATTAASPVYVVDVYASVGNAAEYVPNSTNTADGVHPNVTGSGPIADAWMAALLAHGVAD